MYLKGSGGQLIHIELYKVVLHIMYVLQVMQLKKWVTAVAQRVKW
jgi:hypothetical protein